MGIGGEVCKAWEGNERVTDLWRSETLFFVQQLCLTRKRVRRKDDDCT